VDDRPILIVGCPRSGTSLVRDLLRSHPRLTFPPETIFLSKLHRMHGDPRTAREARRLASDFLRCSSIRRWHLDVRPEELEGHRSFAGLVAAAFDAWAATEGKPRWGDKTPMHAVELPRALEIFPGGQVVHVVRDGRDVAVSLSKQPFGPTAAYWSAVMWRRCVDEAQASGATLGPGVYHELRYEELLADPELVLRRLCAFLGEDWDPAVLVPSRLPAPGPDPPLWADKPDAIDRANAGGWREQLSTPNRVVFESVAGETLQRLGYGTVGETRAIGRLERRRWALSDLGRAIRWRLTTWDRRARIATSLLLVRARLLRALGLTGA
jgi:hypothetical protein